MTVSLPCPKHVASHLTALGGVLQRPVVHGLHGAEHVAETTMPTCGALKRCPVTLSETRRVATHGRHCCVVFTQY